MLASAFLIIPAAIMFVFRLRKYRQFADGILQQAVMTAVNSAREEKPPADHDDKQTGLVDGNYAP